MFQGWGVGLTVTDLGGSSAEGWPVPEGAVARPSRSAEVLPVAVRSDAEIALELGRVVAVQAALVAYKAELVMGLAAHRPDALVPHRGGRVPGAMPGPIAGTSEFFVDVLATTAAGVAEAVAPRVLPAAVGMSLGRLRARLTREVLTADADAADQRLRGAERAAEVRVYPTHDGMSPQLPDRSRIPVVLPHPCRACQILCVSA